MTAKKNHDSEPLPEEAALEARIDAMMDPRRPDKAPAASAKASQEASPPPLDIFKDKPAPVVAALKTAPPVPSANPEPEPLPEPEPKAEAPAEPTPAAETEPPTEQPEPETSAAAEPPTAPEGKTVIDGEETDKAVDDIAASDGDTLLASEDTAAKTPTPITKASAGWRERLGSLIRDKRFWAVIVVLVIALFALPVTRYKLLGIVIKEPIAVSVIDSKTHVPVSSAQVAIGGVKAKTDANGNAKLKAPLGKHQLAVTKQYFKTYEATVSVGFKSAGKTRVNLVATGRQVPITVFNKITGKPLAGVEIKVLDTTAKTNNKGQATIVLPATATTDAAEISRTGYNTAKVQIQVTSDTVSVNTIQLVPSGHIYLLSNLNGTIDVIKTNLDGSGRKTVVEGTGKEDASSTSLLASRDWRFLVLKARRDTAKPALYLIDTSNDKLTAFEEGNTDITPVGWYGHNFIYDVVHDSLSYWQSGRETIKSYDADRGQPNQIDQNQAQGDATSYAYQSFYNFYIVDNAVAYNTQWYAYAGADLAGKNATIRVAQPAGQSKKDYQSFPAADIGYIQTALYQPAAINYEIYNSTDNKLSYYKYQNQAVATTTGLDQSDFEKTYPTFLLSPSGKQTFWTELRDGKNSLFLGNEDAGGKQQIASLSDYAPYGWFSDSYVLVSKDNSQLYIMAAGELKTPPLKVTDYYKPTQNFTGYGYGYGGL
jgi:hypothetical protein